MRSGLIPSLPSFADAPVAYIATVFLAGWLLFQIFRQSQSRTKDAAQARANDLAVAYYDRRLEKVEKDIDGIHGRLDFFGEKITILSERINGLPTQKDIHGLTKVVSEMTGRMSSMERSIGNLDETMHREREHLNAWFNQQTLEKSIQGISTDKKGKTS